MIPNDPNPINKNGKYLKQFLKEHENLILLNSQSFCQGLITRTRNTVLRTEKAVLDFFIVCNKMLPFIMKVVIDEERKFALTNYAGKIKESDNFTMIFDAQFSHERKVVDMVELLNFKNQECQAIFKEKSPNRMELLECFQSEDSVTVQGAKWFKS